MNLALTSDNPIFPPPLPTIKQRNNFPINKGSRYLLLGLIIGLGLLWFVGDISLNYYLAQLHKQSQNVTSAPLNNHYSILARQFEILHNPDFGLLPSAWPAEVSHNSSFKGL